MLIVPSPEWEAPNNGLLQLEQRRLVATGMDPSRQVEIDRLLGVQAANGPRRSLGTLSIFASSRFLCSSDVILLMDAYAGIACRTGQSPVTVHQYSQLDFRVHMNDQQARDFPEATVPRALEIVCRFLDERALR